MRGLRLAVVSIMILIAGCGGGGGGSNDGSSGSGNSVVFTANPTSVTFSFNQGDLVPAAQNITVTATGSYTGTLYVAAEASGAGLASPIDVTVAGTSATVPVQPAAGLAAGTYSGTLKLLACSDSECQNQVGNSPLSIAYSITVIPTLQVSPSSFSPALISGNTASTAISVELPAGQSTFSTQVQSGSPWLTVSNVSASGFTVNVASLPSGTWSSSVIVTSGGNNGSVTVTDTVTPPAGGDQGMVVTQQNLTISTVEDTMTAASALRVTPPSWNPIVTAVGEYASAGPTGWLSVTPSSGGFQVVGDATNLVAGSYSGDVRVSGAYPQADIVVPVAFTVGVGLMRPADINLTLQAETTTSALSGTVPVNLTAGPVVGWTATSDQPWLKLTNAAGSTGSTSITYTIDQVQVAALANAASYPAHVAITPTRSTMSPVTFNVILNKQLPQITSLAPYVQLTGQAERVVLRGSGFSAISSANLNNRFTLGGTVATLVTAVNDTEVVANFAAEIPGSYTVAVSNALGMQTLTGTIKAIASPSSSYSYASIPTGGQLGALIYDPERDSLYVANRTTGQVVAYRFNGTQWTSASTPVTGVYDLGLSNDGTALFVAAGTTLAGSFTTFSPATLGTQVPAVATNPLEPSFNGIGFGVVPTNDGRSWFGIDQSPGLAGGGETFGTLTYLSTSDLTPTIVTPSLPGITVGSALDGPWFAASRDGERLLICLSGGESPQPPLLYLNAKDETLAIAPNSPPGIVTSFSLSESGDRVALNKTAVYDASFNLVGAVTLPAAGQYVTANAVVSPDATRLYVMAYATSGAATSPRIFVFDAQTAGPTLNSLGYFDIANFPSCTNFGNGTCYVNGSAAISLDGGTLFFAGDQNFIVVPVPPTLTPFVVSSTTPSGNSQSVHATTPWPLKIH
jgi:hypothetical protein